MSDIATVEKFTEKYKQIRLEIGKVIVGQKEAVDGVLMALFCNSHALLVGVPGLAKTLLIKTISEVLDLKFNRIQFTPDLMPGDITGNEILDENRAFKFIKGPLFANIILADEINRTPPKTQSALLEAMQERNVTVSGKAYPLDNPFFVLATQNPIEQEGTYPLPEAQLDRFMLNLTLTYPSFEEEMNIVKNTTSNNFQTVNKIMSSQDILEFQTLVRKVPIADNVIEYAVGLVSKTRPQTAQATAKVNEYINYGAGPRAGQFLVLGAKCNALLNGKLSPDIEDVKTMVYNVLRHRLVKNYKAEAEGLSVDDIVKSLL
ncbi:MAG: MoxR family ATPase [Bacteroidetes bacterium]|nr:MoxR family ATPase [Bacteroidota bacterium]